MQLKNVPFNIDLLLIGDDIATMVKPVTSLDAFTASTKNFHPDGLYSAEIFGTVGTDARYKKYSYIDLKVPVLHPTIYLTLLQLKGMYGDIMSGREFAIFDEELCDFVKSDAIEGETGYEFFIKHFKKIKYVPSDSVMREQNIKLMEERKNSCLMTRLFVLPAGYRDLEIDDSGRESSDEINSLYYKAIAISNTIPVAMVKTSPAALNQQRNSLQQTVVEIYKYVIKIVEGKKNLMMNKFAARKVWNSTRNVLTSMDTAVQELDDEFTPTINHTSIGIFQFMKGILPVALYHLKNGFLGKCFASVNAPALLTDMKTLKSVRKHIRPDTFDKWMTNEGLSKIINSYKEPSIRDEPIVIEGCYLGLVYRGPDMTFVLHHGIDELPEERNKEHCQPLTLNELFYASIYSVAEEIPMFVTRYPIATDRSTYPSMAYLMSTIKYERRHELSNDWRIIDGAIAPRFPIRGSETFNSESPHPCRLSGLGADFDGDTGSGIPAYAEESKAEVQKTLNSKSFYVGPDGDFALDLEPDTIKYVLHNLSGD